MTGVSFPNEIFQSKTWTLKNNAKTSKNFWTFLRIGHACCVRKDFSWFFFTSYSSGKKLNHINLLLTFSNCSVRYCKRISSPTAIRRKLYIKISTRRGYPYISCAKFPEACWRRTRTIKYFDRITAAFVTGFHVKWSYRELDLIVGVRGINTPAFYSIVWVLRRPARTLNGPTGTAKVRVTDTRTDYNKKYQHVTQERRTRGGAGSSCPILFLLIVVGKPVKRCITAIDIVIVKSCYWLQFCYSIPHAFFFEK